MAATVDFIVSRIGPIAPLLLLAAYFGPISDTNKLTVAQTRGLDLKFPLISYFVVELSSLLYFFFNRFVSIYLSFCPISNVCLWTVCLIFFLTNQFSMTIIDYFLEKFYFKFIAKYFL